MKSKIRNYWFVCLACMLGACSPEDYRDAVYPENKIYMSTAVNGISENGIYVIDKATDENPSVVTPGASRKYILDKESNSFIVLLGIVQSGLNNRSDLKVSILVNDAKVDELVASGKLPKGTLPLPKPVYTLPSIVDFQSAKQNVPFDLSIRLDALSGVNIGKKYAVAVKIACSDIAVNPDLSETVILIDTAFLGDLLK